MRWSHHSASVDGAITRKEKGEGKGEGAVGPAREGEERCVGLGLAKCEGGGGARPWPKTGLAWEEGGEGS